MTINVMQNSSSCKCRFIYLRLLDYFSSHELTCVEKMSLLSVELFDFTTKNVQNLKKAPLCLVLKNARGHRVWTMGSILSRVAYLFLDRSTTFSLINVT